MKLKELSVDVVMIDGGATAHDVVDAAYSLDDVISATVATEVIRAATAEEIASHGLRSADRPRPDLSALTVYGRHERYRETTVEMVPVFGTVPLRLSYAPQAVRNYFKDCPTISRMTDEDLMAVARAALSSDYVFSAYGTSLRFAFRDLYHRELEEGVESDDPTDDG